MDEFRFGGVLGSSLISSIARGLSVWLWDYSSEVTGEHEIGLSKMRWWADAVSPEVRTLHRAIKRVLDPKDILNPGKFV